MTTQTSTAVRSGEYVVTGHGYGDGWDYYLTVTGPDGTTTEHKLYWTYSKTPFQVAEEAVALRVGAAGRLVAPTRQDFQSGDYVVTLA